MRRVPQVPVFGTWVFGLPILLPGQAKKRFPLLDLTLGRSEGDASRGAPYGFARVPMLTMMAKSFVKYGGDCLTSAEMGVSCEGGDGTSIF